MGALETHRLPGNQNFAGIALISTGQDLHQRRFAGRVVADKAKNLPGIEREIDIAERLHGSEGFFDAPHFHDRLGWYRVSHDYRPVLARFVRERDCRRPKILVWRTHMSISTATIRMTPMKTLIQCCGMLNPWTLSCRSARTSVMTAAPASAPIMVP